MQATGCGCRLLPRKRKHGCANGALQGGVQRCVLSSVQLDADADLLHQMQPAANAGCCRATNSQALQRYRSPSGLVCGACRDERVQLAAKAGLLHRKQPAATAGCCRGSESMAAQTEPFKAECSAFMLSEMQLPANAGWLQREQPAADAGCCRDTNSEALQRKRSPSGLVCSACRDERDAAACECRLLACKSERSTATVTKPFRAGVQRLL